MFPPWSSSVCRYLRPSMLQQLLRRLVFDVPLLTEYCKMPLRVCVLSFPLPLSSSALLTPPLSSSALLTPPFSSSALLTPSLFLCPPDPPSLFLCPPDHPPRSVSRSVSHSSSLSY